MFQMNPEQQRALDQDGHVLLTACPGSGKTRVLTARVVRGLAELSSTKRRVVALTFTNRATDEICSRLDALGVEQDSLWAGTIHAFALEWILRPYAPYEDRLRYGFRVADERYTEKVMDALKASHGKPFYFEVSATRNRDGICANSDPTAGAVAAEYFGHLRDEKMIDYDEILYYAYKLVIENKEIAETIGQIIELFCVDEIQDTQDLQYAILAAIFRAARPTPTLFFVGDSDQCIYESLGAILKSPEEIADDFGLDGITPLVLSGNYRSTQRMIDYYRQLRPGCGPIQSLAPYAEETGMITFRDKTIVKEDLPVVIAGLINRALAAGVPPSEICVLAPQWQHVRVLGRSLAALLPDVDFDAPGLSPLHGQRENIWFKIARLLLTRPSASLYRTRSRWAREVLRELQELYACRPPEDVQTPRQLLRVLNSLESDSLDGLEYLKAAFTQFLDRMGVDTGEADLLRVAEEEFFEHAETALARLGEDAFRDVDYFRKLFRHPAGVVISTCHSVKGEEYDTVIAFGLLKGYVPHWKEIINQPVGLGDVRASKLLFVVCSRAKRQLHLIAESGRYTASKNEYVTTPLLAGIDYEYD